jgi:hypothetical protein
MLQKIEEGKPLPNKVTVAALEEYTVSGYNLDTTVSIASRVTADMKTVDRLEKS